MQKVVFINLYETSYLGTRCLAAYLRKKGHDTHNILVEEYKHIITDSPAEGEIIGYHLYLNAQVYEQPTLKAPLTEHDMDLIAQALELEKPDVIGFSSRSTHNFLAPRIVGTLKKGAPNALLVAGGFGPTLEPEIYHNAGFDAVIRGDGEEAILDIVDAWEKKDKEKLVLIPNTVWAPHWGGNVNEMRDQKKDLSCYPAPLSGDKYFSYIHEGELHRHIDPVLSKNSYFTFFGRGCIGTCSYCSGGNWSKLYRMQGKKAYKRRNRSIDSVIDEIRSLPDKVKKVVFTDEYWGNSSAKTMEFFQKYKERCGKPFFAYLDYEQMVSDPELFNLALDAGLFATGIGIQTGSREFAKKYYNRNNNYELFLEYANLLFNNFIHVNPQFIGGNCYETWDDYMQTIDFIRKLPFSIECPHVVQVQSTQLKAHPKSPLREIAPRVVTEPMSTREWHYRAILMELARLLDKETFNSILKVKRYRQKPAMLQKIMDHTMFKKQYEHFRQLIEEKSGLPWVFYGAASSYERNKKFFAPLKPKYMLLDAEFINGATEIDGLPVLTPEEFFVLPNARNTNFMVFAPEPWQIQKRLLRNYQVPYENIHSCASSWASPFAADSIEKFLSDVSKSQAC